LTRPVRFALNNRVRVCVRPAVRFGTTGFCMAREF